MKNTTAITLLSTALPIQLPTIFDTTTGKSNMAPSSIVLITGGNTGVGYETVKALYASPQVHTILMGSRSLDKAKDAISKLQSAVLDSQSEIVPIQIDIENDASIQNAFKEVESKYGRVDVLVNNAGMDSILSLPISLLTNFSGGLFDAMLLEDPSPTGIRTVWNKDYSLNVTSTQVVTYTFAPLLIASPNPRLLFLTSGLSSLSGYASGADAKFNPPPPKGWPKPPAYSQTAYGASKTALNMLMLDWNRVLGVDGVNVFAVSPGFLATGLGGVGPEVLKQMGAVDVSVGASFIKDVVEGKRDEDAGKVITKGGIQPW
jgi:NAD(P)-dependent dehydrogenase (short-subunit alcohol dehydrogenase family)